MTLMGKLFLFLAIVLPTSCKVWAAEMSEENMRQIRLYAGAAAAAGGAQKCGMGERAGQQALDKIALALRCEFDEGAISRTEADAVLEVIAAYYERGRQAQVTPEICKTGESLVASLLKTEGC